MPSPVFVPTALTANAGTAALLMGPLSMFKLLPSSSNSRLVLSTALRVVGRSVWITCRQEVMPNQYSAQVYVYVLRRH